MPHLLVNEQGFEGAVAISRYGNRDFAMIAFECFTAISVAAVARVMTFRVVFGVAQVGASISAPSPASTVIFFSCLLKSYCGLFRF